MQRAGHEHDGQIELGAQDDPCFIRMAPVYRDVVPRVVKDARAPSATLGSMMFDDSVSPAEPDFPPRRGEAPRWEGRG